MYQLQNHRPLKGSVLSISADINITNNSQTNLIRYCKNDPLLNDNYIV